MSITTASSPTNPSPLWIIALFIALSESMAGIAAIATVGMTRLIFAVFAVAFPVLVLTLFIWVLLKHPANLYSPGQYTSSTTIDAFVSALTRERRDESSQFRQAVGQASAVIAEASDPSSPQALQQQWQVFADLLEKSHVTVDRSALLTGAQPAVIPVTPTTTVDELLDSVYFALLPAVEAWTYNKAWVLTDEDMRPLTQMGTVWAKQHGEERDRRSITEAGIPPGSKLVAQRLVATETLA